MIKYQPFPRIVTACVFLGTICPAIAEAQFYAGQKDDASQKGPNQKIYVPFDEQDQEQQDQGGYQASPATGAMQGPTRELGFSGGEIELPALRLKMPRIRFPSLSYFLTGPRMHVDPSIAPHVQNVQQHVAVPTGNSNPGSADQTAPGENKGAYQKVYYQTMHPRHNSSMPQASVDAIEILRVKSEMMQLEQRLDQKLNALTHSIERLAEATARASQPSQTTTPTLREFQMLPSVDSGPNAQVSHLDYTAPVPFHTAARLHPEPRRLPRPAKSGRIPAVR